MKVIFLDFDGVINNYKETPINEKCLLILKEIVMATSAKIVVTSSNKKTFQVYGTPYLESSCYKNYIQAINNFGISIFDFTPHINSDREKEIEFYLQNHSEIQEFLIFDDDYFFDKWNGHQIFIDLDYGLSSKDLEPAISILNGDLFYYDVTTIERDCYKRVLKCNQYSD